MVNSSYSWRQSLVSNSKFIEQFQTVYYSKTFFILLNNTKPPQLIKWVGRLIYSSIKLPLNCSTYFLIDSWWYFKQALHLWYIYYHRYFYNWKEFFLKLLFFWIILGKYSVLLSYQSMYNPSLLGPQKSRTMVLIHFFFSWEWWQESSRKEVMLGCNKNYATLALNCTKEFKEDNISVRSQ